MFSSEVDYIVTKYTTHPSAIAVSHSIACDSRKIHTLKQTKGTPANTQPYTYQRQFGGKFLYRVFQLNISTRNNATDPEVLPHTVHTMAL